MSQIETIRVELARALSEPLGLVGSPIVPATPSASMLYLRPPLDRPYLDFTTEPARWNRPLLSLDAVIIAPGTDYARVVSWCDERIDEMRTLLKTPFEVAGHSRPTLLAVGSPGPLDVGQLFAFELQFTPIHLGAL